MTTYLDYIDPDIAGLIFFYMKESTKLLLLHLSEYESFRSAFNRPYVFINKILYIHPWIDTKFNNIQQQFKNLDYVDNISTYFRIASSVRLVPTLFRNFDTISSFTFNINNRLLSKLSYYIPELSGIEINDNVELGIENTSKGIVLTIGDPHLTLYQFDINRKIAENIAFDYYLST